MSILDNTVKSQSQALSLTLQLPKNLKQNLIVNSPL